MGAEWQGKRNYVNDHFLKSEESAEWSKTVKFNYRVLEFPLDIKSNTRFTGLSFFCDNLLIYADIDQDSFILGLNNHTYLEFERVDLNNAANEYNKPNRFQLKGVRPIDSLDQSQVIWLQGWSPFHQEDS